MADEDPVLYVDVQKLYKGGTYIYVVALDVKRAREALRNGTARFALAGGHDDEVGGTFISKYGPMLSAGLLFFEGLSKLFEIDGDKILVSGKVNADADQGATDAATGGGGRKG